MNKTELSLYPDTQELTLEIYPAERLSRLSVIYGIHPEITLANYLGTNVVFWWLDIGKVNPERLDSEGKQAVENLKEFAYEAISVSGVMPWSEEEPPFTYEGTEICSVMGNDELESVRIYGTTGKEDWREYCSLARGNEGGCGTIDESFSDWCARLIREANFPLGSRGWKVAAPDYLVRRSRGMAMRIWDKAGSE